MKEIPFDLTIGGGSVGVGAGEDFFLRHGGGKADVIARVVTAGTGQSGVVLVGRVNVEGEGDGGGQRDGLGEVFSCFLQGRLALSAEAGVVESRVGIGKIERKRELGVNQVHAGEGN